MKKIIIFCFKVISLIFLFSSIFYLAAWFEFNYIKNRALRESYKHVDDFIKKVNLQEYDVLIIYGYLFVAFLLIYYIFYTIFNNKSLETVLVYLSNTFILLTIATFLAYWETDLLKKEITYEEFLTLNYLFLLLIFPFNILFITKIASIKKYWQLLIFVFLPPLSLLVIHNSLKPFLESNKIIWIKKNKQEKPFKPEELINIELTNDMEFWYMGLDSWINLVEFKRVTNLSLIK